MAISGIPLEFDAKPIAPAPAQVPYPVFPAWVMQGTSIYEGLAGPICKVNSRYPEFMFMSALVLQMSAWALHVNYEHRKIVPALGLGIVAPKDTFKSSSVTDAADYLRQAHRLCYYRKNLTEASVEGNAIFYSSPGSPEAAGLGLYEIGAQRAVIFYDELKKLVAKCSIDSSSLSADLLTMLESGSWANHVLKTSFQFEPKSYCCSLVWCTTDKQFHSLWSRLTGGEDGLDSRTFFLLNPQHLKPVTPCMDVKTYEGARRTRARIEKAIVQGLYRVANLDLWQQAHGTMDNRSVQMAEKFALALAVDLGRDCVDEDCQHRGLALAQYRDQVYKWLRPYEADNKLADVQQRILHSLRRAEGGRMKLRDLQRTLSYHRFGTTVWEQALAGLEKEDTVGIDTADGKQLRMIWLIAEDEEQADQ